MLLLMVLVRRVPQRKQELHILWEVVIHQRRLVSQFTCFKRHIQFTATYKLVSTITHMMYWCLSLQGCHSTQPLIITIQLNLQIMLVDIFPNFQWAYQTIRKGKVETSSITRHWNSRLGYAINTNVLLYNRCPDSVFYCKLLRTHLLLHTPTPCREQSRTCPLPS